MIVESSLTLLCEVAEVDYLSQIMPIKYMKLVLFKVLQVFLKNVLSWNLELISSLNVVLLAHYT